MKFWTVAIATVLVLSQNFVGCAGDYGDDYNYDGNKEKENETVVLEPTTYPDPKLRKKLLSSRHEYDRVALPFINGRYGTTVEISLTVTYYSIREQEQTLEVHGWPQFVWKDPRLQWDPTGNEEGFLHFQTNEIWLPDLVVYNGARPEKLEYYGRTNCLVDSSGLVMWVPPSRIDTYCTLNILKWPRDTQRCTVKIGSWSYHDQQVDVTLGELKLNENFETDNTEWILLSMKGVKERKIYDCCPRDHYSSIIFTFDLKRRSSGFFYTVVMPIALMCLTNNLVFWLPPVGGERVLLGGLNFMGCLLLLMFIRTQLPNANRVPYIVMLCGWNMMLAVIGVITSVAVSSIGRLTATYKLPQFIKNSYKPQLLNFLCIGMTPSEPVKPIKRYSIRGNSKLGGIMRTSNEDPRTKEEIEKEEEALRNKADWEIFASFIDRLSFVINGSITLVLLIALM